MVVTFHFYGEMEDKAHKFVNKKGSNYEASTKNNVTI